MFGGGDWDSLDDFIELEAAFPGIFSGEAEVECPHCGRANTVAVDDPLGTRSYICDDCNGGFVVDWAARQVRSNNE